ncbi:MAG TPA: TonB-dependent receptor, partial [Vicinamibacterales bacterium]|nr:TonB-dependent receptor [Vicinamibacterales bacterium]
QHVWAGVSRAQRAPSVTDRDLRLILAVAAGPMLPVVVGHFSNPTYDDERLVQTEAGYRVQIGRQAAIDATVFHGRYEGLPTYEPLEPAVELAPHPHLLVGTSLDSLLRARASGLEVSGRWQPRSRLEFSGWYAFLRMTARVDAASLDLLSAAAAENVPAHQWRVQSAYRIRPDVQVSASAARTGRLAAVPAHTRVDARAEIRLERRLTATIVGQNLLDPRHAEFTTGYLSTTSSVPRSARIDLRWEF